MKRIAIIDRNKCNPLGCGDYLCIRVCPVNKMGKGCIIKADYKKAKIIDELCNGCGICPKKCPYDAISIINLPDKLTDNPIHRFGPNMFELFTLPIVKPNTIVGLIGRNGIGKSTALSILAGQYPPNLGNYKQPPTIKEIEAKYSTTILGDYFKKLFAKEIVVSYKPQRVELLAVQYKGHNVKNLLKKIDERNIAEELMKELDIDLIGDRNVDELSGGELQRLAIVAAISKKASVYYFDEPSSFCDITHRIKVAKLIRDLGKTASVIVVEHDLATLDYISDEIQIVYGEQSCYGIISQSKSVRRGVNEYLDGFLPDDNMRFREYPIKFSDAPIERSVQPIKLFDYPELKKKLGNFTIHVTPGLIHRGEVMTIMGANGLGKTTFMKMLAGVLTPDNIDNTELSKLKIAYKPQYLNNEIEGTVEQYLRSTAGSEFSSGWYKTNILEKLNIRKILSNQIKTLSGGELQKVHIAAALSTNAEIVAMDEPSAFIDVEDRLAVAEVIKEFITKKEVCAIIIDHDIQFIDYIGDSMLVFEGKPEREGHVYGPVSKRDGMNRVLKNLDITYRRDKETHRPRINKPGSQLDQEQRHKGEYYYG